MLSEGDKAPGFDLPRDGGGNVRLSKLKGNPVIVYFYPKDDTSGCTKQAISFSERLDDFAKLGVEIIGISPDSTASHDKFKTKHSLSVALLSDEEKTAAASYGVWVQKQMYGRKYMGIERSTFLIDKQGKISRIWRKVKVPGHVEEVLEAARAL